MGNLECGLGIKGDALGVISGERLTREHMGKPRGGVTLGGRLGGGLGGGLGRRLGGGLRGRPGERLMYQAQSHMGTARISFTKIWQ